MIHCHNEWLSCLARTRPRMTRRICPLMKLRLLQVCRKPRACPRKPVAKPKQKPRQHPRQQPRVKPRQKPRQLWPRPTLPQRPKVQSSKDQQLLCPKWQMCTQDLVAHLGVLDAGGTPMDVPHVCRVPSKEPDLPAGTNGKNTGWPLLATCRPRPSTM